MTATYLHTALGILRDAAGEVNRIGPGNSLADALRLIAGTAVRLLGSDLGEGAAAVIYTYDAARQCFDPASRVSAGEPGAAPAGDAPRPDGMGAHALRLRRRILSYEDDIPLHALKSEAGVRTLACYPLLVSGQPLGVIYVSLQVARRFSDEELLILDTFVHQVAVAVHNTRRFEGVNRSLQRKVDELDRLQRAGRLISSRPNLDDTLREILNAALDLTQAEHGSFRLLDKRAGLLRLSAIVGGATVGGAGERAADGRTPLRVEALAVSEQGSVMGWVAQHRQPLRIDDLREAPWAELYLPLHADYEMRSELAVPLLGPGGGLEGVLNVESPRLAAFDLEAEQALAALATQAIIAIQEAKLLDTIGEVAGQMLTRAPDELFALLIARACDLLNVSHGAIWEIDAGQPHTLTLRAATGGLPPRHQVPVPTSLLGHAVRTRRPVFCADLNTDPRLWRRELAQHMGWVSALIVPLVMRDGRARGAFGVYTTEPRVFSDWDMRLLTWLGNHAAVALQQAEALAQIKLAQERQAVAETFAALGDVSANLLHRVNNLIGVIPVRVQGIAEKCPAAQSDAYLGAALSDIEESARAAMEAARESMAYLRPLRLQPTSVEACCRSVLARLAPPPHVQLSTAGLERLPPVLAGAEQLRLILFNLVENALEALQIHSAGADPASAERGGAERNGAERNGAERNGREPAGAGPARVDARGWIRVEGHVVGDVLDPAPRWVELIVADNGPGVPASARDKIFEPDFSTKRTVTVKKLGFGLWWVKSLIQRLGGSIALVDSAAPGCTFVVRLPAAGPAVALEKADGRREEHSA